MGNIVHSQEPRADVLAFVSENLKRLRKRAGLSQAALAEASGISRRMIIDLEAGETNISLASLDRLAEALHVSFADIVCDPKAESRRIEALLWRSKSGKGKAMLLGSVPAHREAELWSWSLGPGERYDAEPDAEGWHEMVYVFEGRLRLEHATEPKTIRAGDFAIYASSEPYAYVNAGDAVVKFVRIAVA